MQDGAACCLGWSFGKPSARLAAARGAAQEASQTQHAGQDQCFETPATGERRTRKTTLDEIGVPGGGLAATAAGIGIGESTDLLTGFVRAEYLSRRLSSASQAAPGSRAANPANRDARAAALLYYYSASTLLLLLLLLHIQLRCLKEPLLGSLRAQSSGHPIGCTKTSLELPAPTQGPIMSTAVW